MLAFAACASQASAAEPSTAERAQLPTLLRTGARAAKSKDWNGCMEALRGALAIEDAIRTAGDLGLCEEQAGKLVDAYDHLRRAMDAAPAAGRGEPWKSYQAALARVTARVGTLWVTTFPREAPVLLDGRPLGRADGRSFAVEPGKHTIAARLAGYEDEVQALTVRGGDVPHVHLTLKPKAPAPVATASGRAAPLTGGPVAPRVARKAAPRAPFPCVPAWSARGVLVPLACVSGAMLLASGGTAIGFDVHATSLRNALVAQGFNDHTCAPGQPGAGSPDCKELAARGRQRIDARNVTIGAGVAAGVLAVSAALAIALEPLGPRVKATAGANGGGVILEGNW